MTNRRAIWNAWQTSWRDKNSISWRKFFNFAAASLTTDQSALVNGGGAGRFWLAWSVHGGSCCSRKTIAYLKHAWRHATRLRGRWNSPSWRLFDSCTREQNCFIFEKKLSTFTENRSRSRDRLRELEKCYDFDCRSAFLASWLRSTWRVTELQRRSISVLESLVDCFRSN